MNMERVLQNSATCWADGVIVQRFGDLIRGKRSTQQRINESFTVPTLNAAAGDLSLVLPKRILDGIIEMIYALDKVAPGTANDDTLLYGVEVKFYNMEVEVDHNLMTCQMDSTSSVTAAVLPIPFPMHPAAVSMWHGRSRRQFNNKRSEMSIKNG